MGSTQASASLSEKLRQPEATNRKGAFAPFDALLVTVDQARSRPQVFLQPLEGLLHSRRGRLMKLVQRHEERRRVVRFPAENLRITAKLRVPPVIFDVAANLLAGQFELFYRQVADSNFHAEQAIQRDPAQKPGMGVMLGLVARLPNAV